MNDAAFNHLKITNRLIFEAAKSMGFDVAVLDEFNSFIAIGDDKETHYLRSTVTELSSAPGLYIAEEKSTFYRFCRTNKIPIPDTHEFDTIDKAQSFLDEHGAVVVKPSKANHGDGITIGVKDVPSLEKAVALAKEFSDRVVLQEIFPGTDHRLLIVGGRFLAAAIRRPPTATGDGRSTVTELIDVMNSSELRGEGHSSPMTRINKEEVAEFIGVDRMDEILPGGQTLELLGTANLSRGGEAINITDTVHPKIVRIAEKVARKTGLGICGVDVMSEDITNPEKRLAVIEVNVGPGIRMHHFPSSGASIDVASEIVTEVVRSSRLTTIGRAEVIDFPESSIAGVTAKIDTGAYRTSVWASDVREQNGRLYYKLLGQNSPHYSGKELSTDEFELVDVENSFGHSEQRYSIMMSIRLAGRRVRTNVTLSDRESKTYPVLIGRKLLRGKFIVDVSKGNPLPEDENEV